MLQTKYLGLEMQSPLIVGSSSLTKSLDSIIEFEKLGVGAVVLKSLFEEQIQHEINAQITDDTPLEAYEYISNYSKMHLLQEYLDFISQCKKSVKIPIISSVNCVSASNWIDYANKLQSAGSDAIELNIFILPSDIKKTGKEVEQVYFDILDGVKKKVSIPVSLKLSSYFSGFAETAARLAWHGANGLVLFNRFYSPDINIDTMQLKSTHIFSSEDEMHHTLRWVGMLSGRIQCDIAGTTGVHNAETMIKFMLAGANAVQVVSAIYQQGKGLIPKMLNELTDWMKKHNFSKTEDFIGKMSFKNIENPAAFDRVQFMKHFAGIE